MSYWTEKPAAAFSREIPPEAPKPAFTKHDAGKPDWTLLPWEPLKYVVRVLEFGAKKYSRNNWKNCDDVNRYHRAAISHHIAHLQGEWLDPESHLPHLAHAVCSQLFALYLENKARKDACP